jgi:phage tail-like protein
MARSANVSPNNPGMDNVRAISNSFFYVQIANFTIAFKEVSGLQIETEVFEYREGGVNDYIHRLPGPTKSGNIILKRGIAPTQEFMEWYEKILAGNIECHDVIISMHELEVRDPIIKWKVNQAWPCKWSGPNFVAGDNVVAVESLELAHAGLGRA